jgi:hypothetical protein
MAHVLACARVKVAKIANMIPIKYIEALEQNQKISSCCRHPENHEIEAWHSNEQEAAAKRAPDIYIFHCGCGRAHRRFCVGGDDVRPMWECR